MRITRTSRIVAATVMTTVAVASVVTFSRDDAEPDPSRASALPAAPVSTPSVVEQPATPTPSPDAPPSPADEPADPSPAASAAVAPSPTASSPTAAARPRATPKPTRTPDRRPSPTPTAPSLLDVLFPKAP